jgi:hypothetical protein
MRISPKIWKASEATENCLEPCFRLLFCRTQARALVSYATQIMAKPSRHDQNPSAQLDRFTDREDHRAVFQQYLNAATEPPVLMFFGVGGAGKTWLLKKLREDVPPGVPTALIDFDIRLGGQRFSLDPAQALHEIRQ